jgi:dihydroflavonol-4-reductase
MKRFRGGVRGSCHSSPLNVLRAPFSSVVLYTAMIAITGASGLVGGNLARALLAQGREVRALIHRDRRALEGLDLQLVQADVRDLDSLCSALEGAQVVYHLAGRISLEMDSWNELQAVNVQGTRNVVAACLQCGVPRLVHFSSVHALEQAPLDSPLDESRRRISSPGYTPYARSKALEELEVYNGIGRGLSAVILNPTAILGPYDYYPSYLGQAIIDLAKGRIPALVPGGFDWVDVRDVVQGAIQAEKLASSGTHYLLSGNWHSVRQVADLVAELTGRSAPRLTVPFGIAYQSAPLMGWLARFLGFGPLYTRVSLDALQSNRNISHAKASRELLYNPRPFRETLGDTLDWFARNGYLDRASNRQIRPD